MSTDSNGNTHSLNGKANSSHNHSGHALTPASVAATGAVSGSSISDGTGTLAQLRESVSLRTTTVTVTTNASGFGSLGLSASDYVIISVYCNYGEICIPFVDSGTWKVAFAGFPGTDYPNLSKSVERVCTVYYVPKP